MASVSPRIQEVMSNAARLATRGKGILASDESTGTVGKRLQAVGLENTVEMRRAYREVIAGFRNVNDSDCFLRFGCHGMFCAQSWSAVWQ